LVVAIGLGIWLVRASHARDVLRSAA
jgi:hypothetical protein